MTNKNQHHHQHIFVSLLHDDDQQLHCTPPLHIITTDDCPKLTQNIYHIDFEQDLKSPGTPYSVQRFYHLDDNDEKLTPLESLKSYDHDSDEVTLYL